MLQKYFRVLWGYLQSLHDFHSYQRNNYKIKSAFESSNKCIFSLMAVHVYQSLSPVCIIKAYKQWSQGRGVIYSLSCIYNLNMYSLNIKFSKLYFFKLQDI